MKAFEISEKVLIGLSSDAFFEKLNKPHPAAPYARRLEELKTFLREHGFLERAKIISLNDVYGVTLAEGCLEALVVSRETEPMGLAINEERKERGLSPIQIIAIEMIPSEDHASISTTRIYHGEIDREGHLLKRERHNTRN
jgi:pantetheine-phosphate adenylyltransferase